MLKIYNKYVEHGVDNYYSSQWNKYYNPHESQIIDILQKYIVKYLQLFIQSDSCKILDFACGDGLITKYLIAFNTQQNLQSNIVPRLIIEGSDPYFKNKYVTYDYSFKDIIKGKTYGKFWDICVCSYAYHLIEPKDQHDFLTQLALITKIFIVISPSKKIIFDHPSWKIIENVRINKISLITIVLV